MVKKYNQRTTYQERQAVKKQVRRIKFTSKQIKFLQKYIKNKHGILIRMTVLILAQILLEISLLIVGKSYINKVVILLDKDLIVQSMFALSLVVLLYTITSYYALKTIQTISVEFINKLREIWYAQYIEKTSKQSNKDLRIKLLTKITYHFSLIKMGMNQVITNTVYLSISAIIIIALIPSFAPNLMIQIPIFLIIYGVLIMLGYLISEKYISREQTLSSSIISHIAGTIYNIDTIKKDNIEVKEAEHLDKLVELDTYFRIRRTVWMALGSKILFAMLILVFAMIHIIKIYHPSLIPSVGDESIVVSGIITLVLVRLAYSSLRIGLFLAPLRIGLMLSTPEETIKVKNKKKLTVNLFKLYSSKIKFQKIGKYYKGIDIDLKKGDMTKITISDGKESMIFKNIITGCATKKAVTWNLKINGKRVKYNDWSNNYSLPYSITPKIGEICNIGEVILGKNKRDITSCDVRKIYETTYKYQEFDFIKDLDKKTGTIIRENEFTIAENGLLQIAHCLLFKPEIIIIDSYWKKLQDESFNSMLAILKKTVSKDSILIELSENKNKKNEKAPFYTKSYKLEDGKFTQE